MFGLHPNTSELSMGTLFLQIFIILINKELVFADISVQSFFPQLKFCVWACDWNCIPYEEYFIENWAEKSHTNINKIPPYP